MCVARYVTIASPGQCVHTYESTRIESNGTKTVCLFICLKKASCLGALLLLHCWLPLLTAKPWHAARMRPFRWRLPCLRRCRESSQMHWNMAQPPASVPIQMHPEQLECTRLLFDLTAELEVAHAEFVRMQGVQGRQCTPALKG